MTTPSRPLWRAMAAAFGESWGLKHRIPLGTAAELRVIADWVEALNGQRMASIAVGAREVVAQLRAEADRAEAGE